MNPCRAIAAACVAAAAIPLAGLVTVGASPITATGYWVKLGIALPTVPKGGMVVGDDPTEAVNPAQPPNLPIQLPVAIPGIHLPGPQLFGFTAVSALRITGISSTADATLTLKVSPISIPPLPLISTIVACPIPGPWTAPATGVGELSKAPPGNCLNASVGRLASDFSSISFLLPSSFQGTPGELDVELLPGTTGLPIPFLVTFDAPGPSAVHAAAGGPVAPSGGGTSVSVAPVVSSGGGVSTGVATPGASGTSGTSGTSGGPAGVPAATASAGGGPLSRLAGVSLPGVRDDRAHRIMAVTLLLALAAGWFWLGGIVGRRPRRLGALATEGRVPAENVGGVGRFRRARVGRPPRL